MAKIYNAPKEFNIPIYNLDDDQYEKELNEFKNKLKRFCKKENKCPHSGEIIYFKVEGGEALYMIYDYKTLIIIDNEFQAEETKINKLRRADIIRIVEKQKQKKNKNLK